MTGQGGRKISNPIRERALARCARAHHARPIVCMVPSSAAHGGFVTRWHPIFTLVAVGTLLAVTPRAADGAADVPIHAPARGAQADEPPRPIPELSAIA